MLGFDLGNGKSNMNWIDTQWIARSLLQHLGVLSMVGTMMFSAGAVAAEAARDPTGYGIGFTAELYDTPMVFPPPMLTL